MDVREPTPGYRLRELTLIDASLKTILLFVLFRGENCKTLFLASPYVVLVSKNKNKKDVLMRQTKNGIKTLSYLR